MVLSCLWFAAILVWAMQDFTDTVPVGTDYTQTPPSDVSVDVPCRSPFASEVRRDELLPVLTEQPEGLPALAYTREPCRARRDSTRTALMIDGVVFVGLLGTAAATRRRRVVVPAA